MAGLQVLNPEAQKADKNRFHGAKRVSNLVGKTIGLYDNGKPGGEVAQQRLAEQLAARIEGLRFLRYSGSMGGRSTLTAKGAETITKECDAVIGIRGD